MLPSETSKSGMSNRQGNELEDMGEAGRLTMFHFGLGKKEHPEGHHDALNMSSPKPKP